MNSFINWLNDANGNYSSYIQMELIDKPTCLGSFKFLDYISDLDWYFFTVDILIPKN